MKKGDARVPGEPKVSKEERKRRDAVRQSEKRKARREEQRREKEKKTGRVSGRDSGGPAKDTKPQSQTPSHIEIQKVMQAPDLKGMYQVTCRACGAVMAAEGEKNAEAVVGAHRDCGDDEE
jgi:hypothetical protein